MFSVVAAVSEDELVIVAGKFECSSHLLVREGPIAVLVVQIVGTVLQEDADRFAFRFANQSWVDMPAADVGEAADVA